MNGDMIPQYTLFVDFDAIIERNVVAKGHVISDAHLWIYFDIFANLDILTDNGELSDIGIISKCGRGVDSRFVTDSLFLGFAGGIKFEQFGEAAVCVIDLDHRSRNCCGRFERFVHDHD